MHPLCDEEVENARLLATRLKDAPECTQQLTAKEDGMSLDEIILRMKHWCKLGCCTADKAAHQAVKAKQFILEELTPEEEADAWVYGMVADRD